MDTYGVLKHFFVKYGKIVSDEKFLNKTYGALVSKNSISEELEESTHSPAGFSAKNKTLLLTMLNDFIKVGDVLIIENEKYRVFSCDEHIYNKKPLYKRYTVSKIDSNWGNL